VVDTSVAVKWGLREPDTPDAYRVAADVRAAGGSLILPELTQIEIAHVVWTRVHRKLLTPAQATAAWSVIRAVPHRPLSSLPLLPAAYAIAVQYDIAAYDALFVAAVQHLGCQGVTADEPLVRAVGGATPAVKLLRRW
jgi:predicted nucleic acid-binding protein